MNPTLLHIILQDAGSEAIVANERQHGDDGVVREVFDGSHAEAEVARVSAQAKKDKKAVSLNPYKCVLS